MVLPPYVYRGDWREMKEYISAVFRATSLSTMLYNNPVAYGTDFLPTHIAELAQEFETFEHAEALFLFQLVFMDTAAIIPTGAGAEIVMPPCPWTIAFGGPVVPEE